MSKFRKKPVVVDAVQFDGGNYQEIMDFVDNRSLTFTELQTPKIMTLEGEMIVNNDDWIIRGVRGEFYPCKPDIFEDTYEPI